LYRGLEGKNSTEAREETKIGCVESIEGHRDFTRLNFLDDLRNRWRHEINDISENKYCKVLYCNDEIVSETKKITGFQNKIKVNQVTKHHD